MVRTGRKDIHQTLFWSKDMKKKKWLLGALLLLLIVYLVFPVLLQLFYQWGYNKNELMNMVIIGHRGGASIGIENTLTCYQKGIEAGADMIEIDIQLEEHGLPCIIK